MGFYFLRIFRKLCSIIRLLFGSSLSFLPVVHVMLNFSLMWYQDPKQWELGHPVLWVHGIKWQALSWLIIAVTILFSTAVLKFACHDFQWISVGYFCAIMFSGTLDIPLLLAVFCLSAQRVQIFTFSSLLFVVWTCRDILLPSFVINVYSMLAFLFFAISLLFLI